MDTTTNPQQQVFDQEYYAIMNGFSPQPNLALPVPQWTNPSDFIVKFSLYQQAPYSIVSTNTCALIQK